LAKKWTFYISFYGLCIYFNWLKAKEKYVRAIFRILNQETPKIKAGKVGSYIANLVYEVSAGIRAKF
jgi:hypothetical protein